MRMLQHCLTLVLVLGILAGPAGAQGVGNPDLFGKSVKAAEETVAQYGRFEDGKQLERVNRIGYELAQHTGFQKLPFTFGLVDMPVPNAFALPGGQIFVTRGLLDLDPDDDMLANVLGHEITHVTHEHYLKMQHRATLMNVLGNVLIAGVLIGADHSRKPVDAPYDPRAPQDTGGDLVQGAAAASLVVSELLLRSYSRDNEDDSDDEGQRLAAAAGYDPAGARRFWQLLNSRAPQAREYGYWQTHPFPEERMRAAEVRGAELKIQPRQTADPYRQRTQATLDSWIERQKPAPAEAEFLKQASLAAWPQGRSAEALRLEKLHALRDAMLAKPLLSRDYGAVVRAYREERDAVRALTPESPLVAKLDGEVADFERKAKELYPKAVEVLDGGVYETSFLVAFLSNFPEAPEVPEVALALGDAYSRLGNQTDAVSQYLRAWEAAPESKEGKRAHAGLRNLAPNLRELAALQELVDREKEPEVKRLSNERLAALAKTYDDIAVGAEYLRRFPEGDHVAAVIARLNVLADDLYGEVVLYQGVGESLKAMERINKILTHAPLSPAAERLRDRALLEGRAT